MWGNQSMKSVRPESSMKTVIQITARLTERAGCCLYEETESSRESKSLPDISLSSLTLELLLITAHPLWYVCFLSV